MVGEAGVCDEGVPFRGHRMRMGDVERQLQGKRSLRMEADHNRGIRRAGKILRREGDAVARAGGRCHRRREVQRAPVVANLLRLGVADAQAAQRLVILAEMALDAALEALRFRIVLRVEGRAHLRHGLRSLAPRRQFRHHPVIGMLPAAVGLPRPEGNVIQGDPVFLCPAVNHRAEAPVPKG